VLRTLFGELKGARAHRVAAWEAGELNNCFGRNKYLVALPYRYMLHHAPLQRRMLLGICKHTHILARLYCSGIVAHTWILYIPELHGTVSLTRRSENPDKVICLRGARSFYVHGWDELHSKHMFVDGIRKHNWCSRGPKILVIVFPSHM
jgi:hypothetical protein